MCGIAGIVDSSGPIDELLVKGMMESISHRGPDGKAFRILDGAALASTRLAIIDIEGGAQPMSSPDGRWTLVYNGEVYNHVEIRRELEQKGHRFETRCDTEVVLHAVMEWGMDAPNRLRGIFAYGAWDSMEKRLIIARDRLGVKPVYTFFGDGWMAFASEIKALMRLPRIRERVEPDLYSIYLIMAYGFTGGNHTAFDGIEELPPGQELSWKNGRRRYRRYWELDIPHTGEHRSVENEDIEVGEFLDRLREATRLRLMSDAPLGAFISGGPDSSLVAALAASESGGPLKTFCVGFDEALWDETAHARKVAEHIGSDHREIRSRVGLEWLPEVIYYLDQPQRWAGTASLLQLYRAAGEEVKVVLTGEGADEILFGYPHLGRFLKLFTGYLAGEDCRYPEYYAAMYYAAALRTLDHDEDGTLFGPRVLDASKERKEFIRADHDRIKRRHPVDVALYLDIKNRLDKFVVFMQDRLSMAAGVEARVPYLDHELLEYSMSLPPDLKLRPPRGKYILRRAAKGLIPAEIADRAKHGFVEPADAWMRSELPGPIAEALTPETANRLGYFRAVEVSQLLEQHRSGAANLGHLLIGIASVHIWHDIYFRGGDPEVPAATGN